MDSTSVHFWGDVASVVVAIVQILGFLFVIIQVKGLKKSLHSSAHSNIYARYADTIHYLLDKPDLYPYFRENVPLSNPPPTKAIAAQVDSLCELTTALFEHATLERSNMPACSWKDCWLPYIKASYEKSPEMREFFDRKADEYYIHEYHDLILNDVAPKMTNPAWVPKVKR